MTILEFYRPMPCAHKDCSRQAAAGFKYCEFHQRFVDDKALTKSSDSAGDKPASS